MTTDATLAAAAILAGDDLPDTIYALDCHLDMGDPIAEAACPRIRDEVRRIVSAAGRTMPRTGTFLDNQDHNQ